MVTRRDFLKGLGGAIVGLGIERSILNPPPIEAKETAVEVKGKDLPGWVKDIFKNHNKKGTDTIPLARVVYINNRQKFIETRKITNPAFLQVLGESQMFTWDEREKNIFIIGDSPKLAQLKKESELCGGDIFTPVVHSMAEHETVHWNGDNSEVNAYTAQIDYLTKAWQQARLLQGRPGYPATYVATLEIYLNQYKEKREQARTGKIAPYGHKITPN